MPRGNGKRGSDSDGAASGQFCVTRTERFTVFDVSTGRQAQAQAERAPPAGAAKKQKKEQQDQKDQEATPQETAQQSTARRDHLAEIEVQMRELWEAERTYEASPPALPEGQQYPTEAQSAAEHASKFFVTFPFPYMNGRLHLGHAFSLTKAEFAVRYQRLQGKTALWPYGFHCTGTPIQAAANRLQEEITEFGNPPVFPAAEGAAEESAEHKLAQVGHSKKAKAQQKGAGMRQWDVLRMMVPEDEIASFADPLKWLQYFPPYGQQDLKQFGSAIDWRRSFITTSANPFFDRFVRWQFRKLKELGYISFGKRPSVYSVKDGEPCLDHDRAQGENVGPQEYIVIKLEVLELRGKLGCFADTGKRVCLAAGTLRPETMYGQTNCFVLPEGRYGAFEHISGDIVILTERAAKGLAFQNQLVENEVWTNLVPEEQRPLTGWDLLGLPLRAPNAVHERVYTLPLPTIKMNIATGVVTSVPSDAPDDYQMLKDLQTDAELRQRYSIDEEMVAVGVVPIIEIPGYGDRTAETMCERKGVKSYKDAAKLKEIKDEVYLKGFYEGRMIVGEFAGEKVCDAKPKIREQLIERGDAFPYFEPESTVVARSGDECIVAFTDQWYLAYGEESWRDAVLAHVQSENFDAYSRVALERYEGTLGWLREWACSRLAGLGTRVPWDEQWLIESLSDSTIYMSYYTIATFIHGENNMDGSKPNPAGIQPEDMTDAVFDFVYLRGAMPENCAIPPETLHAMRREFEYWYPMDLRVSAKDLIPNHLTMALYNHAAIWKDSPQYWPRGYYTNGHVLVDAEKMSKSKGNFLLMHECVEKWGADPTRLALADAGDTMDDANFSPGTANNAILDLYTEEMRLREVMEALNAAQPEGYRTCAPDSPEFTFMDRAFDNEMNHLIGLANHSFSRMRFRDGLRSSWYEFRNVRDSYIDWCKQTNTPPHAGLIMRFNEAVVIMNAPIVPHFSENAWRNILCRDGSVTNAPWPTTPPVDKGLARASAFLRDTLRRARMSVNKWRSKQQDKNAPVNIAIVVAPEFTGVKVSVLGFLHAHYDPDAQCFPSDLMKQLQQFMKADDSLKRQMKQMMQFAAFCRDEALDRGSEALETQVPFDQASILSENLAYLQLQSGATSVVVLDVNDPSAPSNASHAGPGQPAIVRMQ